MPKNPGKRPAKYVIVRNHLLELIRNGLASGSPVPSERELCEQFEVSRMTVRQAIDTLVVDGVLERHQGRGTFVAPPKLDLQVRLTSFTQEMQRRGMEPGVVMLLTETVPAGETRGGHRGPSPASPTDRQRHPHGHRGELDPCGASS